MYKSYEMLTGSTCEVLSLTTSENTKDIEKHSRKESSSIAEDKPTWSRKSEFILALVGYSVGLGNVWRFPYLCYKNGGGAFLIPYTTFAIIAGVPMYFLEISLGQFSRKTAIGVWKLAPSMKGIGYGSAVLIGMSSIYYVIVMAWCMLYLFRSCLPGPLPWTSCDNWWNTATCVNHWEKRSSLTNQTKNITLHNVSRPMENATSPESEFWTKYVLRQSTGLDIMGSFDNWPLILSFIVCWLAIYFCIFKGIRSSGKVVYVTATLPYLMLIILLIRGLTLEGAMDGILYLLRPNFTKLCEIQVWVDAGGQIFYSYGICFTILITFGSYNKFHNNCYKQGIILAVACSLTSLGASFAIFGILGHMSLIESKDIAEVATQGPGLVFQVYPTGLSLLPLPRLWSILFFITLFMIGIDSQFASVEGLIACLTERFPSIERGKFGTEKASAIISIVLLLLGLPMLFNGGIYVFELFNMYAVSGISLLFIAFFESMAIGWMYGVDRYFENVKEMIGYYPSSYLKLSIRFLTPALTLMIFLFYCVEYTPLVLDGYVYPPWANAIGWVLCLASMLCVPGFFAAFMWKSNGSLLARFRGALYSPGSHVDTKPISEKL